LANIEQTPGPQGSKGDTGARGPAGSAGETVVVETSSNSASECAFATSTALAETQLEVAGAPMGPILDVCGGQVTIQRIEGTSWW